MSRSPKTKQPHGSPPLRSVSAVLVALLGVAVTVSLHAYQDAPLITAGVWTGVTWLLVLTCAANRQAALAAARERDALRRRETTALARLTE
ncbi:MAG: hypothetical protein ACYTGR_06465, partial [Planctomycetota bacterium]